MARRATISPVWRAVCSCCRPAPAGNPEGGSRGGGGGRRQSAAFLLDLSACAEGQLGMDVKAVERRLAVIFAADMVGYSRLMEIDEAGTLARLRAHRLELIDPAIAKNKGRIIKTTGDGMLVEFGSVTEAVQCAAEIQ